MRRHLTYSNLAATLALLFAMTGSAIAAKHYLISSTAQISPKVLKKLRGHPGPAGKQGPQGKEGAAGRQGAPGTPGLAGPTSVIRMDSFAPVGGRPNESREFKFLGEGVREHFADARTDAEVNVTVDIGSSDGKTAQLLLGICYMPVGGSEPIPVSSVGPEPSPSKDAFFAQSVSGVITGLAAGDYVIGACTASESANVEHGNAEGTVVLAETAEGGTIGALEA
jgi:hypothetical protein